MNVHHLELFYYVAKFEGITNAVRRMPYGIQQPAVSSQLKQLEEQLGVKLLHRRPFALTPAGEMLYDFCYPFFSQLDRVEKALNGEEQRTLRLAASAVILRDHLPQVLSALREREPGLRLAMREVMPPEVPHLLLRQEVDLAISVQMADDLAAPASLTVEPLVDIPPALVVPEDAEETSWEDFLELAPYSKGGKDQVGRVPLVCLPDSERMQQLFTAELRRRKVDWSGEVEVNSFDTISCYVAEGFGVGLGLAVPGKKPFAGTKLLPLPDFPVLTVAAFYQGKLRPLADRFLKAARVVAQSLA